MCQQLKLDKERAGQKRTIGDGNRAKQAQIREMKESSEWDGSCVSRRVCVVDRY